MYMVWGGVSQTIMAGTHGYGFGYILEIKKVKKDDSKNITRHINDRF